MDDRTTLTQDLTELVRLVPGVAAIYSSVPLAVSTLAKVTKVVVRGEMLPDLVAVTESNGETVVSVTIGVNDSIPATRVCRQVYEAISDHFALVGVPQPSSITVKVGRIG